MFCKYFDTVDKKGHLVKEELNANLWILSRFGGNFNHSFYKTFIWQKLDTSILVIVPPASANRKSSTAPKAIEVASVIELSEASGWVAAGLFMTEG